LSRVLVILNPVAGRGRAQRELLRIDDHLSDLLAFTGRPQ
jgi:hypothetical protein